MIHRWVYHCFTDSRIWASLGKAGITKIAYNFRRDRRIAQLCSCRQRINWRVQKRFGQSWDYKNRTTAQLCSCRHNATAVAWRHTTAEVKCKEKGWWNWHDDHLWRHTTAKVKSKCKEMDGRTSWSPMTQPKCMRSKVNLRLDSPLFHQMFVNIWGLFICQTPVETNDFPNAAC